MRKEKKVSAYSQKRGTVNVINYVAEKTARSYRVKYSTAGIHPTLELIAPFPDDPGGERSVDITFLLSLPHLWDAFSDALSEHFRLAKSSFVSVVGRCRDVKNGFAAYLEKMAPDSTLADISTDMVEDYIEWLRRKKNGSKKYKKTSKQLFWMGLTTIINTLQTSNKWSSHLSPHLIIRENVWRDEDDDSDQVEIIPESVYRDIYIACNKEIVSIMEKVRSLRALMEANLNSPIALQGDIYPADAYHPSGASKRDVWAKNPYKDLGLCLASLRHRVPGVILSITELEKMQDKMLLLVLTGKNPFGSIPGLYSCFYPYSRDLIPFILMLEIHFDYNPETLLKSRIEDYEIRRNEIGSLEVVASPENISRQGGRSSNQNIGEKASDLEIIASPQKGRSKNKKQIQIRPATDDPDNPANIVKFLIEWMSFIRPLAPPTARNRLFLYVTEQRIREIRSFSGASTAGNDKSLRNSLARFYKDNGLPHIALNRFRTTGLDITDVLFGGDIRSKQAAANHASQETTYRRYTTNAQRQRGDEFLGQVAQTRKRWRESLGRIDPRNRPSNSDIGAATPGWLCVDPFSGPYTPGKLCCSYGKCPACPHGSTAKHDPYACAQAWNLLQAIDDAASSIAPQAWVERWKPVKEKLLNVWLPSFPKSVQAEARRLKLTKLPPLE